MEILKKNSTRETKFRTNLEKIGQEMDKNVFRKAVENVLYVFDNSNHSLFDVEGIGPSVYMSDGLYIPSLQTQLLGKEYDVPGHNEAYFKVQKLLLAGIFGRDRRIGYLEKWLDESSDAKV